MKKEYSIHLYIGSIIIGILFIMMVISLFYTPYNVTQMDISHKFQSPNSAHWLGTDHFGRDIFSRILVGSQTAFKVGAIAVSIGLFAGLFIGAVAGYFGGLVDEVLMRLMDALMAFPGILFALVFVAIWGVGINNTMIALGILAIPSFARISRSGYLQAREMGYVKMAKAACASPFRIMFIHILPNIISPLIVAVSIGFANSVLAEAGLSYLGLGVQPPNPSWGRMLSESQVYLMKAPYYALAPGIMITLLVFGCNLLGDGIRDLRDPRKRKSS